MDRSKYMCECGIIRCIYHYSGLAGIMVMCDRCCTHVIQAACSVKCISALLLVSCAICVAGAWSLIRGHRGGPSFYSETGDMKS